MCVDLFCCVPSASVPEYNLTGEFCRKHFLTGLLLRELGLALQDEQDLRHLALATLKTLMAKHSLDARYATKVDRTCLYEKKLNGMNNESWAHSRKFSQCDSYKHNWHVIGHNSCKQQWGCLNECWEVSGWDWVSNVPCVEQFQIQCQPQHNSRTAVKTKTGSTWVWVKTKCVQRENNSWEMRIHYLSRTYWILCNCSDFFL